MTFATAEAAGFLADGMQTREITIMPQREGRPGNETNRQMRRI